jgi:hypothetical protein
MAQTFWALMRGQGNGTSSAYLRQGQVDASGWAWIAPAIPLPVGCWGFATGTQTTIVGGVVRFAPDDDTQLYISVFANAGAGYRLWAYRYDTVADTFTQIMSEAVPGVEAPVPTDFVFATISGVRNIWLLVVGSGYVGTTGTASNQGVYQCVGDAGFALVGSGHFYPYNSGNINNPASPTGMMLDPGPPRRLWVSHTETRPDSFSDGHWISISTDDGVTWDDQNSSSQSSFSLGALAYLEFLPGQTPNTWYAADFSGTGPYSNADQTGRWFCDDGGDTWINWEPLIGVSGQICMPFPSAPQNGIAWPSFEGHPFYTHNNGNTWTDGGSPAGFGDCFGWRAGRCHPSSPVAVGISVARATDLSYIWWTEDAGDTWHQEVLSNVDEGVSLDFGPPEFPPVTQVLHQTLTFRDSRMFVGQSRYYVSADTDAEAHYNALGMASLLSPLSNGHFTGAVGPYTTPPTSPTPGSNDTYQMVEMVVRLTWITANGVAIGIDVPCPKASIFIADQESLSYLNPDISVLGDGGINYKLCTRGGELAVSFVGGTRIMRGFRSNENVRTLDPTETNSSE